MLKIKKDNVEKIVTSGAFENLYKSLGYEVVNETKKATVEKTVAPQPEQIKEEVTTKIEQEEPKQQTEIKSDKKKGNK